MSAQDSHEIGVIKVMLTKGTDGRGIESIEKTSTSGIYDTYTITYDDGSKTTYTIANGNGIASITKTGTSGLVDTYTITFDNGMVETFDVTNGDYISNIAKTGTSGAVDTYTITMASGTTYTFTVVNGDGSLATDIIFDDTNAQLGATTAQGAIDALAKPTFTEASTRANIASGEKLSVILGKIKKFFTDLKAVAFSGSYNDLSNKPNLATVATSGSYNDLTNKPSIPTHILSGTTTLARSPLQYFLLVGMVLDDSIPSNAVVIATIKESNWTNLTKSAFIYTRVSNQGGQATIVLRTWDSSDFPSGTTCDVFYTIMW